MELRAVSLEMPSDAEAIQWLKSTVNSSTMSAGLASNVVAINLWLDELKGRLNAEQEQKPEASDAGGSA